MILNKDKTMSKDNAKIVDFLKSWHSSKGDSNVGEAHWKVIMDACSAIQKLELERDQARRMAISKDAQEAYGVAFPSIAQQIQFCMEEYPEWEYLYENSSKTR